MKKSLMATVAAAALFAGTGFAMAEGAPKEQPAAHGGGAVEMNKGGAGADVKGGADVKSGAEVKGKADTKDAKPSAQTEPKKPATVGQAEQKPADPKSQAQSKDAPAAKAQDNKTQAQDKTQDSKQPAAKSAQDNKAPDSKSTTTTGQGAAAAKQSATTVNFTTEQKTTIRKTVIQSSSAPRVQRSSINFNISVGTVVPRSGIRLVAVPTTLVEYQPAWRGYEYFIVDDEIIIVEPGSLRIVAVFSV